MSTKQIFSIPSLPTNTDPQICAAFASLIDQLNNSALATGDSIPTVEIMRGIVSDAVLGSSAIDYYTPPKITGIRTISGQGAIIIMWDRQVYKSFAHCEVWKNETGILDGSEQKIGTAGSFIYTDLLPNDTALTEYFYWIKGVSNTSPPIVGEFNSTAGTSGVVSAGTAANIGSGKIPATSVLDLGNGIKLIAEGNGSFSIGTSVQISGAGDGSINLGNNLVLSGVADGTLLLGNALVLDAAADGKIDAGSGVSLNGAGAGLMSFGTGLTLKGDSDGSVNVGNDVIISGLGPGSIDLGAGAVSLSGDGSIILSKPGGISGQDYVIMTNGELQYMVWDGIQHIEGKALRQIYSGVANSGDVVTIGPTGAPIFFKKQPKIIPSIASLMAYNAAYPTQNQSWDVSAENLREDPAGSGYWKFDSVCRLQLASSGGTDIIGWYGGNSADNSYIYSAIYSTENNCVEFSPTINARSNEYSRTDLGSNYYKNKNVKWRVKYGTSADLVGGLYSTLRTKSLAGTFDNVQDSTTITGLAPNKWYYQVEYYFEDAVGEFISGAVTYDSWATETELSTGIAYAAAETADGYSSSSDTLIMPIYSAPAGWEIYDPISYAGKRAYEINAGVDTYGDEGYGRADALGKIDTNQSSTVVGDITIFSDETWEESIQVSSYDAIATVDMSTLGSTLQYAKAKVSIKDIVATIKIRHIKELSTIPTNNVELVKIGFTVGSASILSSGSISYTAIGL